MSTCQQTNRTMTDLASRPFQPKTDQSEHKHPAVQQGAEVEQQQIIIKGRVLSLDTPVLCTLENETIGFGF